MRVRGVTMLFGDTLRNVVTGLGTEKDRLSYGRFVNQYLDRAELTAMYESEWIAAKIVDAPADDETRAWRNWSGGPKQVAALNAVEHDLKVRQRVNRARKMARLSGGSLILIGDGDPHPEKPMDIARIGKGGLKYLHALSRWDVTTGPIERDMLSPYFGSPSYYGVHSTGGAQVQVHPSRVVRFTGAIQLDQTTSFDGWGIPALQRVHEAVRNAVTVANNLAALTNEAKIDVFTVPNLNQNAQDPTFRANLLARFGLVGLNKSINNSVLMDGAETWNQKQIGFANHVDVMWGNLEVVAAASDIPATRFLSTSPKGMNATGTSDTRNYYDRLSSGQELDLRPALLPLDIALARHAGVAPSAVTYSWAPLWQMSEAETAAIALQKAQAADIYATLGITAPSAMRAAIVSMLLADGSYPGLAAAIAIAEASSEAAAPLITPTQKVEKASPAARAVKT